MYFSDRKSHVPLLDSKRMYIHIIKDSWYWADIHIESLKYIIDLDFNSIKAAIVLLDLGGGAHGRVWLCCSLDGYVFVLKFSAEETISELIKESKNWKIFWDFNTMVETWNDRTALMMPFLLPATEDDWKDKQFVERVSDTIKQLAVNGLYHQDLRKRHVGKYIDKKKQTKIAFFDLSLCEANRKDKKEIEILMKNSLFDNNYHILEIN
ncbi:hypothetical protein DICPUDRAFT_41971 [Dictyostelium purpureum]|uniref:DUF5898 domain-containing protein n=1 Tax=Dictyostelium purpureum TaxID=5786 RepID=F1A165_DICPU|nr:uncharacterized protein DICPUDRAFT_41971 [Dictyostelium purpureum]EGC30062.1 hypothetical protein DICPUDRAFT_41971 [Dictyostelium purpureum]|eukprot:XP_003293408.1 hypothetical protein DICPUDRAFT_41971 [Dictyostelium purpureum]